MLRPLTTGHAEPSDEERELLVRLRGSSHEAFAALYDRYKLPLTGNLLRVLRSPELVEEVIQDLFMGIWEHRERIDPDKPIKAYLYRVAANKAKNIFRKAANDRKMRELFLPTLQTAHNPIEDSILQAENHALLHSILNQLPAQQYRVYTLCKLEGKTYKEVSELLGISEGTVNVHIRKANRFLKDYLAKHPNLLMTLIALSIQQLH